MADINDLLQERTRLIEESRALYDVAESEDRDLTDEEKANDDARQTKINELKDRADRLERQQKREREAAAAPQPQSREPDVEPETREVDESERQMAEFRHYLKTGETRALSADLDAEGGYTVPEVFSAQLIQAVDDQVFVRQRGRKFSLRTGESLGFPVLDSDPADSDWTAELATGSADSTMDFAKRELRPHPLAKRLLVSRKLLRASAIDIDALVRERLAYKFGITEEKGFMTGSGAGRPLGLFTASAQGISTSRDVSTGNTTSSITFDGLLEAQYSLKGNYWNRAVWIFHRDALKQIRKLKDGNGQYIWQPGGQAGQPDMLLGRPFLMSEYAPNTFTTGLYVGLLGDLSFYWIVDALNMSIQVLNELYATSNQVGFIGRLEVDGAPVLEEAFARVTLA